MEKKIKVGQIIYVKGTNNYRRDDAQTVSAATVSKVGNKFFELEDYYHNRFFIDTLIDDGRGYSSQYKCYLSMQEVKDEEEHEEISKELRKVFTPYGTLSLTLEQLRRIKTITDEKNE